MSRSAEPLFPEDDSLLPRDELLRRLADLEARGFPPEDTAFLADGIIRFSRHSEDVLAQCINHLDAEPLRELLTEHLLTGWRAAFATDSSRAAFRGHVVTELRAKGMITTADGITLPNGRAIGAAERIRNPELFERFCRRALLAVGLVGMQDHPRLAPSY